MQIKMYVLHLLCPLEQNIERKSEMMQCINSYVWNTYNINDKKDTDARVIPKATKKANIHKNKQTNGLKTKKKTRIKKSNK